MTKPSRRLQHVQLSFIHLPESRIAQVQSIRHTYSSKFDTTGRATFEAVSWRILTANAWVPSQDIPCGICGEQSGSETVVFSEYACSLMPQLSLHQCCIHIYSSITCMMANGPISFTFVWPCIVTNFLIIQPTRCTNFSNLFWKWNSTYFGELFFPSSGVIHCELSNGICHAGL
jgi:hypothetical protein